MNHIRTVTHEPPSETYFVEFHPSAEDYVYIATRVNETIPTPVFVKLVFQGFLLLNAIVFPAFLWFNEHVIAGIVVLALNIAVLSWLIPWLNSQYLNRYYDYVIGSGANEVTRVELTHLGVRYSSDDCECFWPWHRIETMEEQDEAVYFLFKDNGFAVRKSGFAYRDRQIAFMAYAQAQLRNVTSRSLQQ